MDTCIRLGWLITLGLTPVLLLRKPARRLFGAEPAFTLWLLPVLLAASTLLPRSAAWLQTAAIPSLPGTAVLARTIPAGASGSAWPTILTLAWLLGAVIGLARLAWHYRALVKACRPLPAGLQRELAAELRAIEPRRVRLHAAGPAVLWSLRSRLLLPPDLLERFAPDECRLVLRHELAHLQRGDALWSLLAEVAHALLWFHPMAWLALPRFRLDRELACDERVLRATPGQHARYAHALIHSARRPSPQTLIPWLAEPQLKERLMMIQRKHPGAWRRRSGLLVLGLLAAGSVLAAQTQGATPARATPDTSYNSRIQPRYPASAVRNHEQGTVVLDILVAADGHPLSATYNAKQSTTASASLIGAASDAAMKWQFHLPEQNGKPVQGYARVPVEFRLSWL